MAWGRSESEKAPDVASVEGLSAAIPNLSNAGHGTCPTGVKLYKMVPPRKCPCPVL